MANICVEWSIIMCGLAGYNICLDEAHKLGTEGAQELNRIGWSYNLHRGIHAHGLVATFDKSLPSTWNVEQKKNEYIPLWWYKSPGIATDSIDKGSLIGGSPINLAMHTRDYTRGTPTNNNNNHPVNVGRSWVTHNGGINNHKEIKSQYGKKGVEYPEVDSIAIPLLLDEVVDPFNPVEVQKCIDNMAKTFDGQSSYTFHAMWTDAPGLSLLALGKDRPLIIAYHEDRKIFVYASEIDAVLAMLEVFNLKPEDEGLVIGDLNNGKALVVYYGEIMWQYTFTPKRTYSGTGSKEATLRRYLPSGERIGDNSGWSHYTQYGAPYSSTVANKSQASRMFDVMSEKQASQPEWWAKDKDKAGPSKMRAYAASLDKLYGYSPSNDKTVTATSNGVAYYGWVGETEFIFDDVGALRDIIKWSDYKDTDKQPWMPVPKKPLVSKVDDNTDFIDWLSHSSMLPKIPDKPVKHPPKQAKITYLPDGKRETRPQLLKTNEQRTSLVRSAVDKAFVFPNDTRCGNHGNVLFSKHEKPWECKNTMLQAKLLLCSVNSLDDMKAIYPEVSIVETGVETHWGVSCNWVPDDEITISISSKSDAGFLIQESCNLFNCTKRRELYEYPEVAKWAMIETAEMGGTTKPKNTAKQPKAANKKAVKA